MDDPQSLNLYAYVRNNPLSRIDADGHVAPNAHPCVGMTAQQCGKAQNDTLKETAKVVLKTIELGMVLSSLMAPAPDPLPASAPPEIAPAPEAAPVDPGAPSGTAPAANAPRSSLPRAPNGDYLPDLAAQGNPHSTTGTRMGSDGQPYRQGATFDKDGKFVGRTDVTDHGRPSNHSNPHFHPATSPNSVGPAQPIPED